MTATASSLQSSLQCTRSERNSNLASPPQDQDSLGGRGSQASKLAVGYVCRGGAIGLALPKLGAGLLKYCLAIGLLRKAGLQLPFSIGFAEQRRDLKVSRPTIGCAGPGLRRFCVVIRPRVEDTGKMAAVAGLVRGPLRQVSSGPWCARRTSCALSEPLSLSLPGFRAAEEAFPPLGARGGAGNRSGLWARPGWNLGSGSRPERSGSRLPQGRVASRTLAVAASCG